MPQQQMNQHQVQIQRLSNWIQLLSIVYRILIVLGLVVLLLMILLLALTTRFSSWILLVPAILIGAGILLAWLEYTLHTRRLRLAEPQLDQGDEPAGT
jgi:uncharacterized membrane protein